MCFHDITSSHLTMFRNAHMDKQGFAHVHATETLLTTNTSEFGTKDANAYSPNVSVPIRWKSMVIIIIAKSLKLSGENAQAQKKNDLIV